MEEFIHPGERIVLQSIISIGFKYHKIQAFIKSVEKSSTIDEIKPGLYLQAFCTGLGAVLDTYRKDILKLEEMYLNNAQLTTTLILATLEKHVTLLNVLQSMIKTVQTDKLFGCLIMGKPLKCDTGGVTALINATTR